MQQLPRRVAGAVAGRGYQDDDDDEAGQQRPETATTAATAAAGQSQGGGKCAHRPRGASQPPKPTTDGASTSFPRRLPSPFSPSSARFTLLEHSLTFDATEERLTSRPPCCNPFRLCNPFIYACLCVHACVCVCVADYYGLFWIKTHCSASDFSIRPWALACIRVGRARS